MFISFRKRIIVGLWNDTKSILESRETIVSMCTTPVPPVSKRPSGNGKPASSPITTTANFSELNLPRDNKSGKWEVNVPSVFERLEV